MADIDHNALGQALDTTWGRSSTPQTATHSVKFTLLGPDRVMASYASIVSFVSEREMIDMKRRYIDEAANVTSEVLKHVKKRYKDLCGDSLTTKEISAVDSLEIINFNVHNPKRSAYYRRKTVYEIG